ncbi:hypothetical protein TRIATDRAFT_131019 [Trichoderma atroviride IMI 206040]|uniref:Uncharacterized protein n=1 Tax=Hypocrea atroviridis (strain ATCC 20476 / IMI 206040) TaxID=452589 RepID=G9P3I0_HYPAI|nr:uncharacterized protein TRIATDRAFT_131019 [Trichoderma atroviride IMI 206040]EHK42938.1 hypothetical protein TRIATDRAFT_131019 [Trichoderma atroviride IMI 206040]
MAAVPCCGFLSRNHDDYDALQASCIRADVGNDGLLRNTTMRWSTLTTRTTHGGISAASIGNLKEVGSCVQVLLVYLTDGLAGSSKYVLGTLQAAYRHTPPPFFPSSGRFLWSQASCTATRHPAATLTTQTRLPLPRRPPITLRFHWATAGPGGALGGGFMQLDDARRETGLVLIQDQMGEGQSEHSAQSSKQQISRFKSSSKYKLKNEIQIKTFFPTFLQMIGQSIPYCVPKRNRFARERKISESLFTHHLCHYELLIQLNFWRRSDAIYRLELHLGTVLSQPYRN